MYSSEKELFELSKIRANVLECIDWQKDMKVLILDDIADVLSKYISERVQSVSNMRNKLLDDMYDVIVSIAPNSMSLQDIIDYGEEKLNRDGKVIYACDNRLGLKYMAGCQRRFQDGFFAGIEGVQQERMYTKKELKAILDNNKGWSMQMYYPYPDQYYTMHLFSDEYLPSLGELNNNNLVSDKERMLLFQEDKGFDTLLREGLFDEFSNAFLVVLSRV